MESDTELYKLCMDTANILLTTLKRSHINRSMSVVCDTLAMWLAKFFVIAVQAFLTNFGALSVDATERIIDVFSKTFWQGLVEFNIMSDDDVRGLQTTFFRILDGTQEI